MGCSLPASSSTFSSPSFSLSSQDAANDSPWFLQQGCFPASQRWECNLFLWMPCWLLREPLFSSNSSQSDVVGSKILCDALEHLPFLHLRAIQSCCSLLSNCSATKRGKRVGCVIHTIAAQLLSYMCIHCFHICVNEEVLMKPKNTRNVDFQEMFPIPTVHLSLWLLLLFLTAEREAGMSNQLVYGRF